MPIPKIVQDRLTKEVRFSANKMREEQSAFRKLYFFSAIHGEIGRVLNWSWDRDLALIHNTFQHAHGQISARLRGARQELSMDFPEVLPERLAQAAQDLADYLEGERDKERLCDLLGRVSELEYATTGNGNFLIEKGILKL